MKIRSARAAVREGFGRTGARPERAVVSGHDADRCVVGDAGHARDNRGRSDVPQSGGEAKDLISRPDTRAAVIEAAAWLASLLATRIPAATARYRRAAGI
jgi:hypothetical protein